MVKSQLLPSDLIVPNKVGAVHTRASAVKAFNEANNQQLELNRIGGGGNNVQNVTSFGSNTQANEMSAKLNTLYASGKVNASNDNALNENSFNENSFNTNALTGGKKHNTRKTNKRKGNRLKKKHARTKSYRLRKSGKKTKRPRTQKSKRKLKRKLK